MSSFPRVEAWLRTAALEEGHEAKDLSMSDPIVPALEYFLSLEQVPGFESRKSRLESEPARPENQNFGIRGWASHCAELGAICLLGQQLELPMVGFDQSSPQASRPTRIVTWWRK